MEILKRISSLLLFLGGSCFSWSQVEGLTVAPGFSARVVCESPILRQPGAMDIDPLTGKLYVDNTLGDNGPGVVPGHIIGIDPASGTVDAKPLIAVSNGFTLKFAPDGTLYFAVRNFLIAKWDRTKNQFRKFAIIPGGRGISILPDGFLLVGEGSYGPPGLFPDSLLRVDPFDGYFAPVFLPEEATQFTGTLYNALSSVGFDGQGRIWASYKGGQIIRKNLDGSYEEINTRHDFIGGLNEPPLYSVQGLLLQYDNAGGKLFAAVGDKVSLVAFGPAITPSLVSTAGVCSDGKTIYLSGDFNKIIGITANTSNLTSTFETNFGNGTLTGTITDETTNEPVGDAQVDLANGLKTQTDSNGNFQFDQLPAGLYEMTISKSGYLKSYATFSIEGGSQLNLEAKATTGLPTWLAPGLEAIVWAGPEEGIVGSSDAREDFEGNIFSMNIDGANITKHYRDPQTGLLTHSYVFAYGAGLAGAWTIDSDLAGNVFCSNGNDGVFKLPPLENEEPNQLTANPNDPTIVTNQYGSRMDIATARDVDGVTILADGKTLIMSSGSGGNATLPCLPEGSINTLLKMDTQSSGCPVIISHGATCAEGETLFNNPDIMRRAGNEHVLVANRGGNVARVRLNDGCIDWFMKGDGGGVERRRLGSYTAPSQDPLGTIFLRGSRFEPSDMVIRMVDDQGRLYQVVGGTRQDWGGLAWPDASANQFIYCDGPVLVLVRSIDGRPISQVVQESVTPE
ncbi:MAG: carboxypeptidase regulatory-like domain-containing protein [Acidobacteria bacterium]|nr:carboxypeptidase regulatory-like domain-containing protein [Acidobacteriota bacterium]MCB9399400.1 carboxypeptidase regulatory-like domain-containing protein [Acidobacteriota bacterium]